MSTSGRDPRFFLHAHASDARWRHAVTQIVGRLEAQAADGRHIEQGTLGFIYLGAPLAEFAEDILAALKEGTGVEQWVGTVGSAIIANGIEYRDEPAISVMLSDIPADSCSVFSGTIRPPSIGERTDEGDSAAWTALVHLDAGMPDPEGLLEDMAGKVESGQLFGGVSSGDAPPLPQIANKVFSGGMSGVVFSRAVRLKTRVSQGCAALGERHSITACEGNLVMELDGEPALDVLLDDLGVAMDVRTSRDGEAILAAMPAERLKNGLFAGIASEEDAPTFGISQFRMRNVAGIDPQNRLIAIGESPDVGEHLVFCTRDAAAARQDLIRMTTELREEIESESLKIRGGLFVSCVARGQALFQTPGLELKLIEANLGDIPITGFYAQGEIAGETLHGYTGVLTLFT